MRGGKLERSLERQVQAKQKGKLSEELMIQHGELGHLKNIEVHSRLSRLALALGWVVYRDASEIDGQNY